MENSMLGEKGISFSTRKIQLPTHRCIYNYLNTTICPSAVLFQLTCLELVGV